MSDIFEPFDMPEPRDPEVGIMATIVDPQASDAQLLRRSHAAAAALRAPKPSGLVDARGRDLGTQDVSRARAESGQTRDAKELYGDKMIPPPYPPAWLAMTVEKSSILKTCVGALVRGVESGGHIMAPAFDADEVISEGVKRSEDEAFMAEANAEKQEGVRFFDTATSDITFQELREATRTDIETIGYGVWEVLRDTVTNAIVGLEHVRGTSIRFTKQDDETTVVDRKVLSADGSTWETITTRRHFRRYVQLRGRRKVYFKEIGDPRLISSGTGKPIAAVQQPSDWERADAAREVIIFGAYNPTSVYPVPRWIGALVAAAGLYKSEHVNFSYFDNKSVPPLAILVQGGNLSKASHKRIAEKLDELKGVENWHKVLILEATLQGTGMQTDLLSPGGSATPRVSIEKLTDAQHGDALFGKYEVAARQKVRSSCGLAPLATGDSQDFTRATAQVAEEWMEKQTFRPARRLIDDRINRFVMPEIGEDGVRFWTFQSKGSNLTTIGDIKTATEAAKNVGVGTRNEWNKIIGAHIGEEFTHAEDVWAKLPIDIGALMVTSGAVVLGVDEDGNPTIVPNAERAEAFGQVVEETVERTVDRLRRLASLNAAV